MFEMVQFRGIVSPPPIIVMQGELREFHLKERIQFVSDKILIKSFRSTNNPIFPVLESLNYMSKRDPDSPPLYKRFPLLKSFNKFLGFENHILTSVTTLYYFILYKFHFYQPSVDL